MNVETLLFLPEWDKLYAKSYDCYKSIKQHSYDLINLLDNLILIYPDFFSNDEIALIKLSALAHDLGKSNLPFQNKLRKSMQDLTIKNNIIENFYKTKNFDEIHHGYLSPAFLNINKVIDIYGIDNTKALINAIFYHHTRKDDNLTDKDYIDTIKNDLEKNNPNLTLQHKYFAYLWKHLNQPERQSKLIDQNIYLKFVVIKGMLNRLDYAASSNKYNIEIDGAINGKYLNHMVNDFITSKGSLRDVQKYMAENSEHNLIIQASTGIGKTEASILWANGGKIFYTLPLKISINEIYKRIINIYKYPEEKTTLIHSDMRAFFMQDENNNENMEKNLDTLIQKEEQTRLLSYPVTICTLDQLFVFVYRYLGSEKIPAVLKYSKLIIDEIQSYSPNIIAKIIFGLKLINLLGGKFAIVTATFPPIFEYFLNKQGLTKNKDYKKPKPFYSSNTARHFIEYIDNEEFNYEEIINFAKNKKILVICNTVNQACNVYSNLANYAKNTKLLHSRFILHHRHMLESKIMEFSKSNEYGIWVSTQIVEASLDIDFDMLYTEASSIDSLLQRMGRCNRKGSYKPEQSNIKIYKGKNSKIYNKDILERTIKYIQDYSHKLLLEQDKSELINKIYNTDELKNTSFFKTIESTLNDMNNLPPACFSEKEAKEKFRDIISINVIPDNIYHELYNQGLIDLWIKIINTSSNSLERINTYNKIRKYSLSINPDIIKGQYDATPLINNRNITLYRTNLQYDFNENNLSGLGLITNKKEDTFL